MGVGTVPASGRVSHDALQDPFITVWSWPCLHPDTVHHSQHGSGRALMLLLPISSFYFSHVFNDEMTQPQDPAELIH